MATVERDEEPPTAPTELTATPEVDGVSLEWEASDDDFAIERYVVFRDGSEIATTTHNELLDSSPAAGEHAYLVYAEDREENKSDASEPVTATLSEMEGPYCESGTCTVSFWHTGAPATWTVPPGVVKAKFTVEGAEGGGEIPAARSQGGRAVATLASLSPGEQLGLTVGGVGLTDAAGGSGGFGGGGEGMLGAGGGGYSSVSRGPTPTLLAGGGGGAGLAGFNASTSVVPGGGSGGSGGEAASGSAGLATLSQEATLGGGAGGASGESGGAGGSGGMVSGTSACPESRHRRRFRGDGLRPDGRWRRPGRGRRRWRWVPRRRPGRRWGIRPVRGRGRRRRWRRRFELRRERDLGHLYRRVPARLRPGKDLLHEPGYRDPARLHNGARPGSGRARR